jgi:hypothetical protein
MGFQVLPPLRCPWQVMDQLGEDLKARVRTQEFTSKLHLVDLAGSERVKRSGVTGACAGCKGF